MSIDLIALTGPMYSGKTTLSRELQKQGYMWINFSRVIQEEAMIMLRAGGKSVTVHQISANKKHYRSFLQAVGELFRPEENERYIGKALEPWFEAGKPKAVFDNVRTIHGYHALAHFGFELVELYIGHNDQVRRAISMGVSPDELERMKQHPVEAGLQRPDLVSMRLDATLDPQTNIRYLLGEPSNQFTSGLIGRETALPQNETAVSQLPDLPTLRGIPIVEHTKIA